MTNLTLRIETLLELYNLLKFKVLSGAVLTELFTVNKFIYSFSPLFLFCGCLAVYLTVVRSSQ